MLSNPKSCISCCEARILLHILRHPEDGILPKLCIVDVYLVYGCLLWACRGAFRIPIMLKAILHG